MDSALALPSPRLHAAGRLGRWRRGPGFLAAGGVGLWLSIVVLLPLAAVVSASLADGPAALWRAATGAEALSALELTVGASILATAVNAVAGVGIAWMLVRDDFRGKGLVEGLIDLPFALPTIVAGLTLLAVYGPKGIFGVNLAFTQAGVFVALLFVTLPFGVRSVQPVLLALDPAVEEAATSLGASSGQVMRRVILPALRPAILAGAALAFARAVGEFGAVTLIAGNQPFKTEYASVFIFGQIESDNRIAAAAVAVALLVLSLVALLVLEWAERRASRHEV